MNEVALLAFDGGNNTLKIMEATQGETRIGVAPHALAQISEAEFMRVGLNGGDVTSAFGICAPSAPNSWSYYVVGEAAYRYNPTFVPQVGVAKYDPYYFGAMFVGMMVNLYRANLPARVKVMAGFPPAHDTARGALTSALGGRWMVRTVFHDPHKPYIDQKMLVASVSTAPEAQGTVFVAQTDANLRGQRQNIFEGEALVIDFGGGTTDAVHVAGGKVNLATMRSINAGAQDVAGTLRQSIARRWPDLWRLTRDGAPSRELIERLLISADYCLEMPASGRIERLDCSDLVAEAINPVAALINRQLPSLIGYRRVVYTGGAALMMLPALVQRGGALEQFYNPRHSLTDQQLLLPATDPALLQRANVIGLARMLRASEKAASK